FQAEDGIRDWSVTGVQTCALPIFAPEADMLQDRIRDDEIEGAVGPMAEIAGIGDLASEAQLTLIERWFRRGGDIDQGDIGGEVRSEERRVGKEGGCGGWRENLKKK